MAVGPPSASTSVSSTTLGLGLGLGLGLEAKHRAPHAEHCQSPGRPLSCPEGRG